MIDMGCPGSIQRDQSTRIHCPAEYVLWYELSLVPGNQLPHMRGDPVVKLSLPNVSEPFEVRIMGVTTVLEPFLDKHVGRIVVQSCLYEVCHFEGRRMKYGIVSLSFRHIGEEMEVRMEEGYKSGVTPFVNKASKQLPETFHERAGPNASNITLLMSS